MKQLVLDRFFSDERGTVGELSDDNGRICYTLEEPWKDNQLCISCIPVGRYICERYPSRTFGEVFIVKDVLHRSGILFHWGNTLEDIKGCILLGRYLKLDTHDFFIGHSRKTFEKFMERLKSNNSFLLDIVGG